MVLRHGRLPHGPIQAGVPTSLNEEVNPQGLEEHWVHKSNSQELAEIHVLAARTCACVRVAMTRA